MATITKEQHKSIADFLSSHDLPAGLGTSESACSIASINLALSGRLTDKIPDCMSYVIGRWIIRVQDLMPSEIRNSAKWKELLPFAAGTGRDNESEKRRMNLIINWMRETVLPHIQYIADDRGFGDVWRYMCSEKNAKAAYAADADANAAAYAAAKAANAADAKADARSKAWEYFDPCSLLEKLIEV